MKALQAIKTLSPDARYRWQVTLRLLVAILVGYAFANLAGILLTQILPIPKAEVVVTSLLLSFAIYLGAILWVFSVRSTRKACLGLIIPTLALGLVVWILSISGVKP